jgi:hypothetical protein
MVTVFLGVKPWRFRGVYGPIVILKVLIFLNKIIFKKNLMFLIFPNHIKYVYIKNYFNIFLNKKYFKKQSL